MTLENIFKDENLISMTQDEIFLLKNKSIGQIELIISALQKVFLNISTMLQSKELPEFSSVDHVAISFNSLQKERYIENKFLYCFTQCRKERFNEISELIQKKDRIKVTGLQGLGKSYFLSDFVLRHRIQGPNSKIRIFYVNNSDSFVVTPFQYLVNELTSMLCFDLSNEEIKKCLLEFAKNPSLDRLKSFLRMLKEFFNHQGIKLVLIWDQINAIFRDIQEHPDALKIFRSFLDGNIIFDCKILSASNANKQIHENFGQDYFEIEMNPLNVFTQQEIYHLVRYESSIYKPKIKANDNLDEYSLDLCRMLNYSIAEYFFYKKSNLKMFKIWTDIELQLNYCNSRIDSILKSETKYQSEYIKDSVDLITYYESMRKIMTIEEFQTLTAEEKV